MGNGFENDYVCLNLIDDILHVTYKSDAIITLEAAKQVVKDRLEFVNFVPKCILAEVSNIKNSSKEAREFLSKSDGGLKGIIAGAFVSKQVYSYFILNLFLKIVAPSVPAKFFMEKEKALEWLTEIQRKNK
ncbi:MAG: hypothetical protein PHE33_00795 [Bacteroidales bacterium]|nr:hypothetical protein [Bacteroidales bacterium]